MACPSCGSGEPFYTIPEVSLERCPNCFLTRAVTSAKTKKRKAAAKKRTTKRGK